MPPSNSNESYCTFTLPSDVTAGGLPSEEDIAKDLESNDNEVKKHALKAAIMAMLGGENMPRILMQVIRFCINSDDKQLKKLCMLYWEVVPKYQEPTSEQILAAASGGGQPPRVLLQEMILVCNALMLDLNHANEFVRGSMLRFLCKVKDAEILTPLIPSIKACLTHRHPYVRKNAALAVFHAHRLHGDTLLPDAPELMAEFLQQETDIAARRNAFLMLFNQHEEMAIQFLAHNMEQVASYGDGFCLLVLELTRQVCRREPHQKSRFVRVLFQMLGLPSAAVSYEAAWTLVSLSSAPTAVRAAAVTYANLLNGQNDNNVKLIVLERLEGLLATSPKIMQELLMDILRAVSSPNPVISEKVLSITLQVVTSRNVQQVVTVLKREVVKTLQDNTTSTTSSGNNATGSYRNMLIRTIHACALKFPAVAESVVHTLIEFLGDSGSVESSSSAWQVIVFVRAIVEQYPDLRSGLVSKLGDLLGDMSASSNQVVCVALWILGEYSASPEAVQHAFETMVEQAGDPPFLKEDATEDGNTDTPAAPKIVTKNVVLADGTYATQTSYSEAAAAVTPTSSISPVRRMLIDGDVFLGEILSVALTKLCLRARSLSEVSAATQKQMTAKAVLVMCGVVKMSQWTVTAQRSSGSDCVDRLTLCTRALLDPKAEALLKDILLEQGQKRFAEFLAVMKEKEKAENDKVAAQKKEQAASTQADDLIHFRQLRSMNAETAVVDLDDGSDLARATGYGSRTDWATELNHVYPLTGFADAVYAEALVTVHDYDIVLEILILNRTPNTLANVTAELSTMGDMKIVERPGQHTIGPLDQVTVRASIKVSSTETGHVFGTLVYTDTSKQEQCYIHLNDIHMDIMDYIRPAVCTDEVFRSMWAEFEWENKVAVATNRTELKDFLDHIVSSTNMRCLTNPNDEESATVTSSNSNFLAANLYARSVFGEDALVNVSIEKKDDGDGKLAGYIRIRSKTQGIALSLGDRITAVQRAPVVVSN